MRCVAVSLSCLMRSLPAARLPTFSHDLFTANELAAPKDANRFCFGTRSRWAVVHLQRAPNGVQGRIQNWEAILIKQDEVGSTSIPSHCNYAMLYRSVMLCAISGLLPYYSLCSGRDGLRPWLPRCQPPLEGLHKRWALWLLWGPRPSAGP